MGSKKVFTKIDLRWRFNNVRIKEGNEWKGAFTMHMGSFKPTVMFFGITNSPATFQAIMNEILRDLINEGKVTAFVDDVYIKPEKCIWKVRKIRFLGVVIGPNRIEMEKKKVDGVMS